MTRDEIIRMARESGFEKHDAMLNHPKELERFAVLVAERDAALLRQALEALQTILNIALMDNGHWAKTIEREAHAAIAKAHGIGEKA